MSFEALVSQFTLLIGIAALISALINVGKWAGIVKDGDAPSWSLGLNLAAFLAFVGLSVFTPQVDVAGLDSWAASIANLLVYLLGFVSQFGASKVANAALRGAPVVGYSHSA